MIHDCLIYCFEGTCIFLKSVLINVLPQKTRVYITFCNLKHHFYSMCLCSWLSVKTRETLNNSSFWLLTKFSCEMENCSNILSYINWVMIHQTPSSHSTFVVQVVFKLAMWWSSPLVSAMLLSATAKCWRVYESWKCQSVLHVKYYLYKLKCTPHSVCSCAVPGVLVSTAKLYYLC